MNQKIKFIFNIFLSIIAFFTIVSAVLTWQIKTNENRLLIWEPDDHFHFLNKASSLKYCKNFNDCYHTNLIHKETNFEDKNSREKWFYERQVHRLLLFYHPLYTIILNFFSNFSDIFESQKLFHLLLGATQAIIIFYYINYFSRERLTSFLIVLILSFHYYYGSYGVFYPAPFTISVLITSLALTVNKRIYSYLFMIIGGLFHKVGVVVYMLIFLTKLITFYLENNKKNINKVIKNFKIDFILIPILFFLIYFFSYSPFDDLNLSIVSSYDADFDLRNFIYIIYKNLKTIPEMFKWLLHISPILLFFFIYSLFIKINDSRIRKLKIFSLLLILTSILYFLPSGGISFAFGNRISHLFTINYTILSVFILMDLYKGKYNKILKILFILTLPIFLYRGFLLNLNFTLHKERTDNYFLQQDDVKEIINRLPKDQKIYFDTDESVFYFFMGNGLIKKNFFYKSNFPSNKFDGILVTNNPVFNYKRSSNFIIENDVNLKIAKKDRNHEQIFVKLFSQKNTFIKVNDNQIKINKGINLLPIKNISNYNFSEISETIYLVGLIIQDDQNTNWPWGHDVYLNFQNTEFNGLYKKSIYKYLLKLPPFNSYRYEFEFDFAKLPNNDKLCLNNEIISDEGSFIVFKNNCSK